MAYTNAPITGLDQAGFTRMTRQDADAVAISFPTETALPVGTPVKFTSGLIVAAENAMAIGIIVTPFSASNTTSVRAGFCTVMVYGFAEVKGITTGSTAAGAELKYVGADSTTTHLKFTAAAQNDIVVAVAGIASGAGAVNEKVIMLYAPYKKP